MQVFSNFQPFKQTSPSVSVPAPLSYLMSTRASISYHPVSRKCNSSDVYHKKYTWRTLALKTSSFGLVLKAPEDILCGVIKWRHQGWKKKNILKGEQFEQLWSCLASCAASPRVNWFFARTRPRFLAQHCGAPKGSLLHSAQPCCCQPGFVVACTCTRHRYYLHWRRWDESRIAIA